jgi:hypothetical protein
MISSVSQYKHLFTPLTKLLIGGSVGCSQRAELHEYSTCRNAVNVRVLVGCVVNTMMESAGGWGSLSSLKFANRVNVGAKVLQKEANLKRWWSDLTPNEMAAKCALSRCIESDVQHLGIT